MVRALLITLLAVLTLTSLAFAQPATWQQLDLDRGQTFSIACPEEIVLLHVEPHNLIGHCGAGGTVPPDYTIFQSPLPIPLAGDSEAKVQGTQSFQIFIPWGEKQ